MNIELLYTQMHLMCMVILSIIGLIFFLRNQQIIHAQWLFFQICAMLVIILITNTLMWLLNGEIFFGSTYLYNIITLLYYISTVLFTYSWFKYVIFKLHIYTEKSIKKITRIFFIFSICAILFILLNFATKLIYTIDINNNYYRGKLFFIPYLISCVFIITIITIYLINLKNKLLNKKTRSNQGLLLNSVILVIAGLIQMLSAQIHIIWPTATIIVLAVFLIMQNNLIISDPLTQLNNRRKLDEYLYNKENNLKSNEYLYYIIIDLNKFKDINDKYGHLEGDKILKDFAEILRETYHDTKCILARTGGDEFVVTGCINEKSKLSELVKRLFKKVEEYNKLKENIIKISISAGCSILGENGDSIEKMMLYADEQMYKQKKETEHGTKQQKNNTKISPK